MAAAPCISLLFYSGFDKKRVFTCICFFAAGFAALRELSSKWALAKSLGLAETDDDDDSDHDGTVARKRRRRRVARPRHKVFTRVLRCFSPLPSFLTTPFARIC